MVVTGLVVGDASVSGVFVVNAGVGGVGVGGAS